MGHVAAPVCWEWDGWGCDCSSIPDMGWMGVDILDWRKKNGSMGGCLLLACPSALPQGNVATTPCTPGPFGVVSPGYSAAPMLGQHCYPCFMVGRWVLRYPDWCL